MLCLPRLAAALGLALAAAIPASAYALPDPRPAHQLARRADTSSTTKVDGKVNDTMVHTALRAISTGQRPSWVQGTYAATLLELEAPSAWNYFTGNKDGLAYGTGPAHPRSGLPIEQISFANSAVGTQDSAGRLCSFVTGEEVVAVGASLDSLACSVPVLLAAVSTGEIAQHKNATASSDTYTSAAARQLDFVLTQTPRLPSGAISQRTASQELWSDGMYMASALGIYGAVYDNQTLLQLAYDQMRLYRDGLLQPSGLLSHIVNVTGNNSDPSLWATGNGWAAAGFLRTIASIVQSSHGAAMLSQVNDLYTWTDAILDSAFTQADATTGLVHNHLNDTSTFLDAAGSALLSYAAFRTASMAANRTQHVPAAEKIYQTIQGALGPAGELLGHLDTVNVLNFYEPGPTSPEALSFILLMSSARRDYAEGNVTGLYGPGTHNQYQPITQQNGSVTPGAQASGAAAVSRPFSFLAVTAAAPPATWALVAAATLFMMATTL